MAWPNRGLIHRPVVTSGRGMVASAHPLASMAGARMLLQGGNAVDAAVATAAALNVCEPYMSGIGGVGTMLVYTSQDGHLRVLDYTGRAPAAATPDRFANHDEKQHGAKAPIVPGAAAGWLTALREHGRLDPATVFAPAIAYAEDGVPLTLVNERFFAYTADRQLLNPAAAAVFLAGGASPAAGTIIRQPALAATFREVAAHGPGIFYQGRIGARLVDTIQSAGGLLTNTDLADYEPEWRDPVSSTYRGYTLHTPPPPGYGFQYLQTLNILEGFDLAASGHNSAETIHRFVEAIKLAVADRIAFAPGPDTPIAGLLSKDYAGQRRSFIDPERAATSEGERFDGRIPSGAIAAGKPTGYLPECTTHFDVVDAEGNAVSVTQSLGDIFGAKLMDAETGVVLNNFAYWFDLDPASPNVIAPRKRVEMCMAPAAVFRDDRLFLVIGTPGSFGIPQTTAQMLSNVLDHGFSVQAAIEAPRFRTYEGTVVELEDRIPPSVQDDLTRRGHQLRPLGDWSFAVGGGQGIMIDPGTHALLGGADPRRDGYAIGI